MQPSSSQKHVKAVMPLAVRNMVICEGTGGYSDIQEGLKVKVTDETGKILGIGELGSDNNRGEFRSVKCVFPFKVEGIPSARFYSIEVGRRGSLEYSRKDLEKQNWRVHFRLG